MKTILQEKRKTNLEHYKAQENLPTETKMYDVLSKYFIWFMNNNIEEFQTFSKFWSYGILNQTMLFEKDRKFN